MTCSKKKSPANRDQLDQPGLVRSRGLRSLLGVASCDNYGMRQHFCQVLTGTQGRSLAREHNVTLAQMPTGVMKGDRAIGLALQDMHPQFEHVACDAMAREQRQQAGSM